MAKTLAESTRNGMLSDFKGRANYIELVHTYFDGEEDNGFGWHEITWNEPSNGFISQATDIVIPVLYGSQDSTTVTGFKLFSSKRLVQGETDVYEVYYEVGEGEFAASHNLSGSGVNYTLNVSGIKLKLPEVGA